MEENNTNFSEPSVQNQPNINSNRVRESILKRISSLRLIHLVIGALALILLFLLTKEYILPKKSEEMKSSKIPVALRVASVELSGTNEIRIVFNDDIEKHVLEHSLAVTPSNNGQLVEGDSAKEFYFKNSEDFPFSSTVLVEVNQGLESKNRLVLLSPRTFTLRTSVNENRVSFSKGGIYGRVIPATEGVPFEISVFAGQNVNAYAVRVFRSNEQDLLKFLQYSVPESAMEKDGTFNSYSANFLTNYFEYPNSALVESYDIQKPEEKKQFNLPKGIYYLEALKGGQRVGSAFVLVNSKGLVVRQDDTKTILAAFDLRNGQKITEFVNAQFYTSQNSPQIVQSREFNTYTEVDTQFKQKIDFILATIDDEILLVPLRIKDSLADIRVNKDLSTDMQMFIYTDRPIYKPGDTLFYRGTVRMDNDAAYGIPREGTKLRVWIYSNGDKSYDQEVTVDRNGLFSGNFIVEKWMVNEWGQGLNVTLTGLEKNETDYDNYASTTFVVNNYTKPTFELTANKNKEEFYRHEKMKVSLKGSYFDSKPLVNEKVRYKVYSTTYYEQEKKVYNQNFNITQQGGMCGGGFGGEYYGEEVFEGEVELDQKGFAETEIDLKNLKLPKTSQMVTVIFSKNDTKTGNKIESAVKTIVHAGTYNIFFIPGPSSYRRDSEMIIPFYIESSIPGEELPKEVAFEFRTEYWNNGVREEKKNNVGTVAIDNEGKGVIRFHTSKIKEDYTYLTVIAKDKNENSVEVQKSLWFYKPTEREYEWWNTSPTQTYLKIVTDSNSYVVGDTMRVNIVSEKDLDVLFVPERGRIYEPQILHISKGENKFEFPVTEAMSPSITMTFSFFADGKYYSEGVVLNVPSMHKLLQVEILPDKESYSPGETAMLTVITKDAKGNKIPAQFSLGIVDEAIYGLRRDATPLIHSAFYYFRNRSTNASSSLTAIGGFDGGGGGGGGGGNSGGKLVDTLFWAPTLQTGENGELVVPVKLANVKTIWRAQVIASDNSTNLGQSILKVLVK